MRIRILSAFLLACAAAPLTAAADDYSQWQFARNIVINTTATGANIPNTVSEFPVLVRLTPEHGDVFANTKANGADIRFTKADGVTRLKHQIERWDAANRYADIWVRVDAVTGNAYTTLRMLWSNAAAADSSQPTQVFHADNGFVGVWHLGTKVLAPERLNSVTGTTTALLKGNAGFIAHPPRAGVIGYADTLRGNGTGGSFKGDHIDLGSLPANGVSTYVASLSMWVKPDADPGPDSVTFAYFGNPGSKRIIRLRRSSDHKLVGQTTGDQGTKVVQSAGNTIVDGEWQYIAFVASPANILYRNGDSLAAATGQLIEDTARAVNYFGRPGFTADSTFRGMIDEVTLSNQWRTKDWIRLSYHTQKPGPNAVTIEAGGHNLIARRVTAAEFVSTPKWEIPDYVFAPGYKVRSLAETEAFVRENRHLPDVPNARQIADKGMDLGEMNLRLLKAVEELTLHVIELDKRQVRVEQAAKILPPKSKAE